MSEVELQYYITQHGDPYPNAVMWGGLLRSLWLVKVMAQKRIEDKQMFTAAGLCFTMKNGEIVKLTLDSENVLVYSKL
jgi:hypothetical protein